MRRGALLAAALIGAGCSSESVEPTVLCAGDALPCVDARFVAHQDDDLLFMNPDIATSIASGNRVITVFVTAGTPNDPARMSQRERGMLNAYAFMVAPDSAVTSPDDQAAMLAHWTLAGGAPIRFEVAGEMREAIQYDFLGAPVSLVFLRIPEENGVDLRALQRGEVSALQTVACSVDCVLGSSLPAQSFGTEQVIDALEALMARFEDPAIGPLAVSTLDATQLYHREEGYGLGWLDHADHLATAELVVAAYVRHHRRSTTTSLHQYRAYNTGREPANVGADTLAKRGAFFRYMALGEGLEYTNGDPDDPHFTSKHYESWTERRYVVSSTGAAQGRLAVGTGARCLGAVGSELALQACTGAPQWELTAHDELRPISDPSSCVVLDGEVARLAPCLAAADAERQTFVLTGTAQIRARGATCLYADTETVRVADCAKRVDGAGDPIGRAVETQRWSWR